MGGGAAPSCLINSDTTLLCREVSPRLLGFDGVGERMQRGMFLNQWDKLASHICSDIAASGRVDPNNLSASLLTWFI